MKTKKDIIAINQKQKEFYNSQEKTKKNIPTQVWSYIRNFILSDFKSEYKIKERVYEQHRIWLGDLSDKKVLDLGCLRGNNLSIYMAENSKEYIGIDLSDSAIKILNKKIHSSKAINARGLAIDFLSEEFIEDKFDVIYAYGVLHHFENVDLLFKKLKEKLVKGGTVISYDPLSTSIPIKTIRSLYRPFQSDSEWEWPFDKKIIRKIYQEFSVIEANGVLGKAKYGVFLKFLLLPKKKRFSLIQKWINEDWNVNKIEDCYKCMQLSLKFNYV